jgi:hypothetical protein
MGENRHKHYEILNLLGYGLAKFGMQFVRRFGFKTKSAFYEHIVDLNIAQTSSVVKNRQDIFDPFFDNNRKGWWQRGDAYLHRKLLIDSLFGSLDVEQYVGIVQLYIEDELGNKKSAASFSTSPIVRSKFRQLQLTGQAAELYFMRNYNEIPSFSTGTLDDARFYGDGYDFQIQVTNNYYLAEIKGVRASTGAIRLTNREFIKASEFATDYALIIVSNLNDLPKMTAIFDPITELKLTPRVILQRQTVYHSEVLAW